MDHLSKTLPPLLQEVIDIHFWAVISIIALLLSAIIISKCIRVISEGQCTLVERFGKYDRTLDPGVHLILPLVERCKTVHWVRTVEDTFQKVTRQETIHTHLISKQEMLYDFPAINVVTKDRLIVEINGLLFFRIIDPVKAVYTVTDLYQAVEQLCNTYIRDIISQMPLEETMEGKVAIQNGMMNEFQAVSKSWGIIITRFDIQSILPSKDILKSIERLATAQREAQAKLETNITQTKIDVQKVETQALLKKKTADAESYVMRQQAETVAFEISSRAEAERTRIENLLRIEGIDQQYLVQLEYSKAWQSITQMKEQNTIIIPMESAKFFGSSELGSLRQRREQQTKHST